MISKQYLMIFFAISLTFGSAMAQEKESAEISLEAYSDAFQEQFFNALQEKAVEHYEKAIHLLLKCKKLQPENTVVDYELAKNHLALKNYPEAESYFKKAILGNPENIWYADALFKTYLLQDDVTNAITVGKQLAQRQFKYKEKLMSLYVKEKKYNDALRLLDEIDATLGVSNLRKRQRIRYNALLNGNDATVVKKIVKENPLEKINAQIVSYQKTSDYNGLSAYLDTVLETYPSQSRFYYIKGKTLNHLKKYNEATGFLETALDFLADDAMLENNIYKELVLAYKASGNAKKVQEYTKKLKTKT